MSENEKQKIWSVDATIPFYRNRIFKWALGVPLAFSVVSAIALFFGSDSPADRGGLLTAQGYQNALVLFAFPLYLITVSGFLGIMVARFHRSKQFKASLDKTDQALLKSEESIALTTAKNDFDRRFKHEEEFLKHIDRLDVSGPSNPFTFKYQQLRNIYSIYFPENTISATHLYMPRPDVDEKLNLLNDIMTRRLQAWVDELGEDNDPEILKGLVELGMREHFGYVEGYFGIEVYLDEVHWKKLPNDRLLLLCNRSDLTWFHFDLATMIKQACCFMTIDTDFRDGLFVTKGGELNKLFSKIPDDMDRVIKLRCVNAISNSDVV